LRALAPSVPECRAEIARLRGDDAGVSRNLTEPLAAYRTMGARGHARRGPLSPAPGHSGTHGPSPRQPI